MSEFEILEQLFHLRFIAFSSICPQYLFGLLLLLLTLFYWPLPIFSCFCLCFSGTIFFPGFGGSFMAPSPSPVTPAQNNLLQPNFEAAFGTTPSTSSSSSFDPSGEAVIFQIFFLFVLFLKCTTSGSCDIRKFISKY